MFASKPKFMIVGNFKGKKKNNFSTPALNKKHLNNVQTPKNGSGKNVSFFLAYLFLVPYKIPCALPHAWLRHKVRNKVDRGLIIIKNLSFLSFDRLLGIFIIYVNKHLPCLFVVEIYQALLSLKSYISLLAEFLIGKVTIIR